MRSCQALWFHFWSHVNLEVDPSCSSSWARAFSPSWEGHPVVVWPWNSLSRSGKFGPCPKKQWRRRWLAGPEGRSLRRPRSALARNRASFGWYWRKGYPAHQSCCWIPWDLPRSLLVHLSWPFECLPRDCWTGWYAPRVWQNPLLSSARTFDPWWHGKWPDSARSTATGSMDAAWPCMSWCILQAKVSTHRVASQVIADLSTDSSWIDWIGAGARRGARSDRQLSQS